MQKHSTLRGVLIAGISICLFGCKKNIDTNVVPPPVVPPTSQILKEVASFPVGFSIEHTLFSSNPSYKATVLGEAASVTFGNEMKHSSIVQSNGTFNYTTADALVAAFNTAGIPVFGHVLGWHSQQNASYIKSYAGIMVAATTELLGNPDFENGLTGWSVFNTTGATITANSVASEAHAGTGSMKVVNTTANPGNPWKVQVSSAAFPTTPGKQYIISYWVRAAAPGGSIRLSTGPTNAQYQGDQTIGTSYQLVSWTITAQIASTTFLFDMGQEANTYYIDDASVKEVVQSAGGPQVASKVDELLNAYVTNMVTRYKDKVKAWDVINELFTESGAIRNNANTLPASNPPNDVFVWSEYLGRDYAFKAFNYAKAADPNALLFINDFNLESNTMKLDSLIAFVNELRSRGAKVDGIGTQMHMSINTRQADIDNMFRKLAATGLKVRISELDIRVNPSDQAGFTFSSTIAATQSDMYKYVVSSYMRNVPSAQRHGITIWGIDDATSWITTSQRKVDFPLLFDAAFNKKPAYTGFLQALKGQ
jgi:endo-1,4-beta-xylanase